MLASNSLTVIFGAILAVMLAGLAVIDWRSFRLPDALTLPLIPMGWVQAYALEKQVWPYIIGAALGYGLFMGVALSFRKLRGTEGLGQGDAKLLAAGGAWCGWLGLPYIMLIASVLGLLQAGLTGAFKNGGKAAIPFGPALCIAIFTLWVYSRLNTAIF